MDIQKGLEMISKRNEANRKYYERHRKDTPEDKEAKAIERAKKLLEAYEQRKLKLKQQRQELNKPRGRPFKCIENQIKSEVLLNELNEIDNLKLN